MKFDEHGYQVVPNFLELLGIDVEIIQQYFEYRFKYSSDKVHTSTIGKGELAFYSDPLIETLLERSVPVLENILNKKLFPTYTYSRRYVKGNELKVHKDRDSCEISLTLSLGYEGTIINPICFSNNQDKSNAIEIFLNPGDACLYKGCDLWHWRPPIENEWYLQSFLHFVDANGPHKNQKYDKQISLGAPSTKISVKLDTTT